MTRWFLVLVVLLVPICAGAIVGDLNKDGKVDFSDFFLFADHFGKEGQPEPQDDETTAAIWAAAASSTNLSVSWVDFDTAADLSDWSFSSRFAWYMDIGKGRLVVNGSGDDRNTMLLFPTVFNGDQDISVEATRLNTNQYVYGLSFRASAEGEYSWGLGTTSYRAARWDPATSAWIDLVPRSDFGGADTNLLRVSIRGNQLTFYINGQKAGETTDSHLASGWVGLFVGGTDKVSFDNLVIARPEQPVDAEVVVHDTITVKQTTLDTTYAALRFCLGKRRVETSLSCALTNRFAWSTIWGSDQSGKVWSASRGLPLAS